MCVCWCVCVYAGLCVCARTCVYVHVCQHYVCVCVYVSVCAYVCVMQAYRRYLQKLKETGADKGAIKFGLHVNVDHPEVRTMYDVRVCFTYVVCVCSCCVCCVWVRGWVDGCVSVSVFMAMSMSVPVGYEVVTISRLLKIVGLFCKRALKKRGYSAKETYNCKEPTNRSHPTSHVALMSM